jgi:hypothetical protein
VAQLSTAHRSTAYRSLFGLEASTYQPHAVHGAGRSYPETNCYTDIIIELLHARGDEPLAALGYLVRSDFEGDQFTFFKPPPEDLERLFGIDIHEMQPYRPLPTQIAEQIDAGRTIIVELDSFHLPDTAATAYARAHVKSSAIAEAIDADECFLRYFHNAGLYELEGDDYRGVFRLDGEPAPDILPPYAEIVRFDAGPRLQGEELRAASRELLHHHLRQRPRSDPFARFGEQLEHELPALLAGDLEAYHAYAFASVRMIGAAFELAASHAEWLLGKDAAESTEAMQAIIDNCKVLSFRLARRRELEPAPVIESLSASWSRALDTLAEVVG